MTDLIDYRWLNMDNRCRTTQELLHKYADSFRGGTWRTVSMEFGGPVLMGYGTRCYEYSDMEALDQRLPAITDSPLPDTEAPRPTDVRA